MTHPPVADPLTPPRGTQVAWLLGKIGSDAAFELAEADRLVLQQLAVLSGSTGPCVHRLRPSAVIIR